MVIRCSKCEKGTLRRIPRHGFLASLCSRFGYYPWECQSCRNRTLLRSRGERSRHKSRKRRSSEPA